MSVNIYLLFGPRSQGLLLARCKGAAEERQRRNTQSGGHRMSENTRRSPHTGPSEHTPQQERTDTYSILMHAEQFKLSLLTEEGKRGEGELFTLAERRLAIQSYVLFQWNHTMPQTDRCKKIMSSNICKTCFDRYLFNKICETDECLNVK